MLGLVVILSKRIVRMVPKMRYHLIHHPKSARSDDPETLRFGDLLQEGRSEMTPFGTILV